MKTRPTVVTCALPWHKAHRWNKTIGGLYKARARREFAISERMRGEKHQDALCIVNDAIRCRSRSGKIGDHYGSLRLRVKQFSFTYGEEFNWGNVRNNIHNNKIYMSFYDF